jgi:hypothetical protein
MGGAKRGHATCMVSGHTENMFIAATTKSVVGSERMF